MAFTSGYVPCACRDCMEIAITSGGPALCSECEEAGCDDAGDSECNVQNAVPDFVDEFETAQTVAERQHHRCCGERITMHELQIGQHNCPRAVRR